MIAKSVFRLKVRAGDKRDLLVEEGAGKFGIWVRARPEQGRANEAALGLLARHLGVQPKRLRIIKGSTSPSKIVVLLGG